MIANIEKLNDATSTRIVLTPIFVLENIPKGISVSLIFAENDYYNFKT